MMRSATNSRTPPSAASGTRFNSPVPNASSASTIAAAARPDTCDLPPVSETMPVRGGLAFTGNAPKMPARMLPAPAPRKSRSTSAGLSGSEGKERVVAAVCTITTIVITKASGTSRTHCSGAISGSAGFGSVAGHRADHFHASGLESRHDHRQRRGDKADQRARNFGADRLGDDHHRQHAKADARSCRGSTGRDAPRLSPMRSSVGPAGDSIPSTPGNCDTRMCTEMPARKPTVTGTDSRFAMPPSLKMPLADQHHAYDQRQRDRMRRIIGRTGRGERRQARRRRSA